MVGSDRVTSRTKHIDVAHHFVRDLQLNGTIELQYCPTEEMAADIFTKLLPKDAFRRFIRHLGLLNERLSEKGCWS